MNDQIERHVVYSKVVNGRRFAVTRFATSNSFYRGHLLYKESVCDWYCGYMQILPADKEYEYFRNYEDENEFYGSDYAGEIHGIGGITYMGSFPMGTFDGYYFGFDTAHYFSRDVTEEEVIKATLNMEKGLEK